ncbi:MAG: type II toxin-antitoxin system death-on-curing family toxin [Chrysiogenales bacterium]
MCFITLFLPQISVFINDLELLKSALGFPAATFAGDFLHADICEMAAAYLFHIVKNHPFIDGNKRIGTVAALVFLILNGCDFNAPENKLVDVVVAIAAGKMAKAELALFFRKWVKKRAGKMM